METITDLRVFFERVFKEGKPGDKVVDGEAIWVFVSPTHLALLGGDRFIVEPRDPDIDEFLTAPVFWRCTKDVNGPQLYANFAIENYEALLAYSPPAEPEPWKELKDRLRADCRVSDDGLVIVADMEAAYPELERRITKLIEKKMKEAHE